MCTQCTPITSPTLTTPLFFPKGIDSSHNPEFTSCEFYQAYGTFDELLDLTEELVVGMVQAATGNEQLLRRTDPQTGTVRELLLTRPFPRLSFVDEICKATGANLHPLLADRDSDKLVPTLLDLCRRHGLSAEAPHTAAALLDRLGSHFVEAQCQGPTFIVHHPLAMSPLAKANAQQPHLANRFELFIDYKEICNAYEGSFSLRPVSKSNVQRFSLPSATSSRIERPRRATTKVCGAAEAARRRRPGGSRTR